MVLSGTSIYAGGDEKDQEEDSGIIYPKPRPLARKFFVKRNDIEKFGVTDKCNGCTRISNGWTGNAAHTDACRERIMDLIIREGDPKGRVQRATERQMKELDNAKA